MAKPASEGGMSCLELDWETNNSNNVRQCKKMANEELPDDLNVASAVAQGKAAIMRYAAWGIPSGALLLISDRHCNIDTPDNTTNKHLKHEHDGHGQKADPHRQPQATHSTDTRQENEVGMTRGRVPRSL